MRQSWLEQKRAAEAFSISRIERRDSGHPKVNFSHTLILAGTVRNYQKNARL
jgi:hypothetical protein